MAILTDFNDLVAFMHTVQDTIRGVFELRVSLRVPHVGAWSFSTATSLPFGHIIVDFTFENRSCQILASCGEICGSV